MTNSTGTSVADAKDWASLPGWARAFASAFVVTVGLGVLLVLMP